MDTAGRQADTELPVQAVIADIRDRLQHHDQLVLQAPPGAGKTTLVPLALIDESWLDGGKIVMLEPRRIATRAAAGRMAELLGESVGQRVGYRMRLESRVGPTTRIEVMTEGVLTRMLSGDPTLDGIGLVIFDEFHERSLEGDLGLALCLLARQTFRETPLKILIMSATLEAERIATTIDAPVILSEGKQYPVEIRHGSAPRRDQRIEDAMRRILEDAVDAHPHSSILAFLPGQREIRELESALKGRCRDIEVMPLFGNLSQQAQRRAIRPGVRKLVLATNIAETSLTIDGVDIVVDSGLAREPSFDPGAGMTRLHTRRISRASAEQRAGRAGRTGPGVCYRLWPESGQQSLAPQRPPEIHNADLAPLALQLIDWGITDPAELQWLDPPPQGPYRQALGLLRQLGALDGADAHTRLSAHGQAMARLPVHPRLAHLLIRGAEAGQALTAARLAALLSDRDPFDHWEVTERLEVLSGEAPCPPSLRYWMDNSNRLATRLEKQVARIGAGLLLPGHRAVGYLIACAYPERIARQRHAGGYQLANGRAARLPGKQAGTDKWLAVAELTGTTRAQSDSIRSASPLDPALFEQALAHLVEDLDVVEWDRREERLVGERRRKIGEIVLERHPLTELAAALRIATVIGTVRDRGLSLLNWTDGARQWQARVGLARELDQSLPELGDAALLDTLEQWLGPYLDGVTRLQQLKKLDLQEILRNRLDWQQQQRLEQWLPTRYQAPSGSRIAIDYCQSPPVVAVKLQEMFGVDDTPRVLQGKLPLQVHLLSPAGRPLQITQDLAHFWRNAYGAVKSEMKGRYPKHPWPDDPLVATATSRTNRALRANKK